jgi:outer membrane protein OmpA-like peptidoglycan-associated protein/opacity protein-like surface antigen
VRTPGLVCALWFALCVHSAVAAADDVTASATVAAPAPALDAPTTLGEVSLFSGGFISNYYHQFYDVSKFIGDTRPELHRLSPEFGVRYAYFLDANWGFEVEGSLITAMTKGMEVGGTGPDASAKLWNGHVSVVFELPVGGGFVPFANAGFGMMHTSSSLLGSDTDWPVHAGGGLKFFITDAVAVRVDGRYLRGPSEQAPYTLNAGYGEFGVGITYVPQIQPSRREPPKLDGDRDGDGIPDSRDKCPDQPEDKDMFQDEDGCPDPDNDGDGIPDAIDKCPLDPEDKDGFQDQDGCPDLDNDGDGIPDKFDKCPNEPEDKDGFQDFDGCPDPDNDNDGIPDTIDKCPNEPETINGFQDEDGCPDKGDSLVVMSPDRLELLESIQFQRGDKLTKSSSNLLGQIGATLRAHSELVRVRITAHVQPSANPDKDQTTSDTRATLLRDWLVKYGIDAKRLEARGFGGTKPLVPADQKGAAAINDRVELIILERK